MFTKNVNKILCKVAKVISELDAYAAEQKESAEEDSRQAQLLVQLALDKNAEAERAERVANKLSTLIA